MTDWKTLDTLPKDRPVLMIQWHDASRWNRPPEAHWQYEGIFAGREPPPHDKSVVAVRADGQYWLRGGVMQNGKNILDSWRWSDIPALPQPLT